MIKAEDIQNALNKTAPKGVKVKVTQREIQDGWMIDLKGCDLFVCIIGCEELIRLGVDNYAEIFWKRQKVVLLAPVEKSVAMPCDCGGTKAGTPHALWCSSR